MMYWYIHVRYETEMGLSSVTISKLYFSGISFAQNTTLRTSLYSVADCMYIEQPHHVLKHIRSQANLVPSFFIIVPADFPEVISLESNTSIVNINIFGCQAPVRWMPSRCTR